MNKRTLCATAVLAAAFSFAYGQSPVRPKIVSARLAGFAGPFAAQEAGIDTLSTNPAMLAFSDSVWSLGRLAAHVSGPLFDLPAVFQEDDISGAILDLVGENNGIYIGTEITGPLSIAHVERNFGFGVFNRTLIEADIPNLSYGSLIAGEEVLIAGGYGLTLFRKDIHSLSAGLQLKGFFQTYATQGGTALGILDTAESMDLASIPTLLATGFGLDAGLLYKLGDGFSAGLVCRDLYTPVFTTEYASLDDYLAGSAGDTTYARIEPELTIGASYNLQLPEDWITISQWGFYLDYRDILGLLDIIPANPVLNVALGTEMILLDVVSLRAGINQTYAALGLGLDLSLFALDVAMYGSELGIDPGARPLLNMEVSLAFEY